MKVAIILLSITTLVTCWSPPGPGNPCAADLVNETNEPCANRCEIDCENIGEPIDIFAHLGYENCDGSKCHCKQGFIRNDDGDCVIQKRYSCDYDPCQDIPHTLWKRCVYNDGPTCYITRCPGYGYTRSKCTCKPGYALNLKGKCIKTSSTECKRLAKKTGCLTPPPPPRPTQAPK